MKIFSTHFKAVRFLKSLFDYLKATLEFYKEIVAAENGNYNTKYVYTVENPTHSYKTQFAALINIIETSSKVIASFYRNETITENNYKMELESLE